MKSRSRLVSPGVARITKFLVKRRHQMKRLTSTMFLRLSKILMLTLPTTHILQTLWRCISFNFDIIGPYFTNSASLESEYVVKKILDVVRTFQIFNLHTMMLIGDGLTTYQRSRV
eukprot:Pompholyxophrys_punicea_v1_NODE_795_length_1280_cov_4.899756.p2 type:complete len:115 gc:universal NODE_795_length_1280_cov_4.899756:58-402(+)